MKQINIFTEVNYWHVLVVLVILSGIIGYIVVQNKKLSK